VKIQVDISSGFYGSSDPTFANMECINWYPQIPLVNGAISKGALFRTPGISAIKSIGTGKGRGFHKDQKNNALFQVVGSELIHNPDINNPVLLGAITGVGRVSMAFNGLVLCVIVPGGDGYFYTLATNTLETITDPIFVAFQAQQGGVTSVVEKGNRFIYTTDEEFFIGSLISSNDGKSFDALDFEDAEVDPDAIVRAMEINNELYIFNAETTELYQEIGGVDFPYQRILGATIDKGLKSRFAVIEFSKRFLFLGNSTQEAPAIWQTAQGSATKISTPAIDQVIQAYTDAELSAVTAWSYSQEGSFFAGFNFPNETFVYDGTASTLLGRPTWHKRQTNGSVWRVEDIATTFGKVIASDSIDGRVGDISRTHTQEYETNITRTVICPYLMTNGNSFRVSYAEASISAGTGTSQNNPDTDGLNPQVELQVSSDSSRTFKSLGSVAIGLEGQWDKRQIWRRLGRFNYSMIMKFILASPILSEFHRLDLEVKADK